MHVVINVCYGGFSLSDKGEAYYLKLKGIEPTMEFYSRGIERHDLCLVQTVRDLGKEADGDCAKLRIVEIPDGIEYGIDEYDGIEHIAEKHRTWY